MVVSWDYSGRRHRCARKKSANCPISCCFPARDMGVLWNPALPKMISQRKRWNHAIPEFAAEIVFRRKQPDSHIRDKLLQSSGR